MAESFDDLVAFGEACADEGRYTEAIEALTAANRLRRTPRIECRLVQLRREAFDALDRRPSTTPWPPAAADPFPDVDGLPEVDASGVSSDAIAGAIAHHGALVVRGLVPAPQVGALVEGMDQAFALRDRSGDGSDDSEQSWFVPADPALDARRDRLRQSGALFAADVPRLVFDLFELLGDSGVAGLVADHFGEPATLSLNKFTLRRVPPDAGPTAWHQDGAFLGDRVRALNLWISLTPCGGDITDTPGLALVPRRIDELLETGEGAGVVHAIRNDLVNERFGDEITRPPFAAGDALFFDERFLHKTGRRRGMSKPRHAIEWWFFPRSAFPEQYQGLVV